MKACGHCTRLAEWRYKDSWGVLACADWFSGRCEGEPLDITPPSVGNMRETGRKMEEDEILAAWMKKRIRELWPLEQPK